MNKKNIVLIITKNLTLPGGVTNFYRIIKDKYNKKDIEIDFFIQGVNKKHDEVIKSEYIIKYFMDIINFIFLIKRKKNIKIIHLNPSFIYIPIIRDSIFILLSKLFGKKVICFFHGWDKNFEKILLNRKIKKIFFKKIYNTSDLFYVLSNDIKLSLEKIGITKEIRIIKTTFDGSKYQITVKKEEILEIIYIGRLQKEKGIFIILKALNELKNEKKFFKIKFIGWFVDYETQKDFTHMVKSFGLTKYIDFKGYLSEEKKIFNLIKSDIFVFPTYYPEGCPTVIMEALAAGLFIITTDIAALKEVIINGINGILINKNDYKQLKCSLKWCLNNKKKIRLIGKNNKKYAFDNFESMVIINRFYEDYKKLISE